MPAMVRHTQQSILVLNAFLVAIKSDLLFRVLELVVLIGLYGLIFAKKNLVKTKRKYVLSAHAEMSRTLARTRQARPV